MALIKVKKVGVQKKRGHMYFIDKDGDISSATVTSGKVQKVAEVGIERQPGYYYIIDKEGDVACAKMSRGGHKTKEQK
jgi:hypothetical protein